MSPLDLTAWEKEVWRLKGSTTLLGAECLVDKPHTVVWVENQAEIMACRTPDISTGSTEPPSRHVVALPPAKLHSFPADDPFQGLLAHADDLAPVKRFVLAMQDDREGNALRDELARRLGRHKCYILKFPPHASTCQEITEFYGVTDLAYAIKEAEPYPINGIKMILPGETMREWLTRPPMVLSTTGTMVSDNIVKFPTDGRLIVVTGIPSMGKSSWSIYVMVHQMMKHGRRFAVFSPEMAPWQSFVEHCITVYLRKPITQAAWQDVEAAEVFFATRLINITYDSTDVSADVDWFLSMSEAAVLRYGITDTVCDPWNALEHSRGRIDRDEYISASLSRSKAWSERFSCNVWIIAHPVKMQAYRPGAEMPEPTMYDIKGGSEWYDRADLGFVVHRKNGRTQLRLAKAKFKEYGRSGDKCEMDFDVNNHCYSTPLGDPGL